MPSSFALSSDDLHHFSAITQNRYPQLVPMKAHAFASCEFRLAGAADRSSHCGADPPHRTADLQTGVLWKWEAISIDYVLLPRSFRSRHQAPSIGYRRRRTNGACPLQPLAKSRAQGPKRRILDFMRSVVGVLAPFRKSTILSSQAEEQGGDRRRGSARDRTSP